jgi:dolichol-phosphate mannosyltransferase
LYGHEVVFTPVNDRLRQHGVSKSDFMGRAVKGLFDLLGVLWLMRRTPAPERGAENESDRTAAAA